MKKPGHNSFYSDAYIKALIKKRKEKAAIDYSPVIIDEADGPISPEQIPVYYEIQNEYLKTKNINEKDWILGQGTIYPDTIESGGTKHSSLIKTHHNRVDAIERLKSSGKLIEPIASYYKDEVRDLARQLELPPEVVNRNPFPGPGLAIRCMVAVKRFDKIEQFHEAGNLFHGKSFKIWKLPQKTVGVQGDSRSESFAVVLEGKIPFIKLEEYSTIITNNIPGINRIVYLVKSRKPLCNARIIESHVTRKRLDLLREADYTVNRYITEQSIAKKIWQFPVIINNIIPSFKLAKILF